MQVGAPRKHGQLCRGQASAERRGVGRGVGRSVGQVVGRGIRCGVRCGVDVEI